MCSVAQFQLQYGVTDMVNKTFMRSAATAAGDGTHGGDGWLMCSSAPGGYPIRSPYAGYAPVGVGRVSHVPSCPNASGSITRSGV